MRYREDDHRSVVGSKDDVEGKPPKQRPPKISIEHLKAVGRNGDEVHQPIQLIEEPNRGTRAPLGVPCNGIIGIAQSGRMEADGPWLQPLNLLRSCRRTWSQAMVRTAPE
ncbi:MAG: hypothetical protein ABI806_29750, partial [Candidatus Solibacter sp.]